MKVDSTTIQDLDLTSALELAQDLDRLPSLLADRALASHPHDLVQHIAATFVSGVKAPAETITMPRIGLDVFGQRPVTLTSLAARTLYVALVNYLEPALPPNSRAAGRWKEHAAFGTSAGAQRAEYLVEFDIASCYEYIDHGILLEELLTRTLSVSTVQAVIDLLGDMFPRGLGLPQMITASDRLADAYLEIIERKLLRSGYIVSRYADDFKVFASSWPEAADTLEEAAEHARSVGLVLSAEKTKVRKQSTIEAQEQEKSDFLRSRFDAARDSLTELQLSWDHYGEEAEFIEVPPEEQEVLEEALMGILREWYEGQEGQTLHHASDLHSRFVESALRALRSADTRVPDDWLAQIIFRRPVSIEAACEYMLARTGEVSANWGTLRRVGSLRRHSPWAKVWLMQVAQTQPAAGNDHEAAVMSWVASQLHDRHELVRSEAVWCLAGRREIDELQLAELYCGASSVTRPGIGAAAGRANGGKETSFSKSLSKGERMGRLAFEWGAQQGAGS